MSKEQDNSAPPDGLLKSLLRSDGKKDGEFQGKCLEAFRNRGPMQPAMTWPEIEQQLRLQPGSAEDTGESLPKWFLELIQHDIIRESEATKEEPVRYKLNDQPAFGERAMERLERIRAAKELRSLGFMKALFYANVILFATIYVFFLPQYLIAWFTGAIGVIWAGVGTFGLRSGADSKSLLSVLPRRSGTVFFAASLLFLAYLNFKGLTTPLTIYGPPGAEVWVDNKYVGRIPNAKPGGVHPMDPYLCRISVPKTAGDTQEDSKNDYFDPKVSIPLKVVMRFQMHDVRVVKTHYTFGLKSEFNEQTQAPGLADLLSFGRGNWKVEALGRPSVRIKHRSVDNSKDLFSNSGDFFADYGEYLNDSFWEIVEDDREPTPPDVVALSIDIELRRDDDKYWLKMVGRDPDDRIVLSKSLPENTKWEVAALKECVPFSVSSEQPEANNTQATARARLGRVSESLFKTVLLELGIPFSVPGSPQDQTEGDDVEPPTPGLGSVLQEQMATRIDNKILARAILEFDKGSSSEAKDGKAWVSTFVSSLNNSDQVGNAGDILYQLALLWSNSENEALEGGFLDCAHQLLLAETEKIGELGRSGDAAEVALARQHSQELGEAIEEIAGRFASFPIERSFRDYCKQTQKGEFFISSWKAEAATTDQEPLKLASEEPLRKAPEMVSVDLSKLAEGMASLGSEEGSQHGNEDGITSPGSARAQSQVDNKVDGAASISGAALKSAGGTLTETLDALKLSVSVYVSSASQHDIAEALRKKLAALESEIGNESRAFYQVDQAIKAFTEDSGVLEKSEVRYFRTEDKRLAERIREVVVKFDSNQVEAVLYLPTDSSIAERARIEVRLSSGAGLPDERLQGRQTK